MSRKFLCQGEIVSERNNNYAIYKQKPQHSRYLQQMDKLVHSGID